jgi:chromosome segregation ATPase
MGKAMSEGFSWAKVVIPTALSAALAWAAATFQSQITIAEQRIVLERVADDLQDLEQVIAAIQDNRFTSNDAQQQATILRGETRAEIRTVSIALDEIRRRVIRIERLVTDGDLDGQPVLTP